MEPADGLGPAGLPAGLTRPTRFAFVGNVIAFMAPEAGLAYRRNQRRAMQNVLKLNLKIPAAVVRPRGGRLEFFVYTGVRSTRSTVGEH